jgi:hypothetical protein
MMQFLRNLDEEKTWVFSSIGVFVISLIVSLLIRKRKQKKESEASIRSTGDGNISIGNLSVSGVDGGISVTTAGNQAANGTHQESVRPTFDGRPSLWAMLTKIETNPQAENEFIGVGIDWPAETWAIEKIGDRQILFLRVHDANASATLHLLGDIAARYQDHLQPFRRGIPVRVQGTIGMIHDVFVIEGARLFF